MVDDRGDGRVRIGPAGDGDADVVQGLQHGIARLEHGVALAKIERQPIDLAERVVRPRAHDDGHNREHEQCVEGKWQEGVEGRIAEGLNGPDEQDGGEDA